MTVIYHDDGALIIINKLAIPQGTGRSRTEEIYGLYTAESGYTKMTNAHEVWCYNHILQSFESFKNRGGSISLLKSFLADRGINIRCDAATIRLAEPIRYRFEDDKDAFLFHLKFGA